MTTFICAYLIWIIPAFYSGYLSETTVYGTLSKPRAFTIGMLLSSFFLAICPIINMLAGVILFIVCVINFIANISISWADTPVKDLFKKRKKNE